MKDLSHIVKIILNRANLSVVILQADLRILILTSGNFAFVTILILFMLLDIRYSHLRAGIKHIFLNRKTCKGKPHLSV